MLITRRWLVTALAAGASCATQPAPSGATAPASASRVVKTADVISTEELEDPAIAGTDALTAIRLLRPAFFRERGPLTLRSPANPDAAPGLVQISQDFGSLQPLSALSGIGVRSIFEVRYFSAIDAQSRFGINANGGPVILIMSSKQ